MARLGRRHCFKPIINGLSHYIQAVRPVAAKPLVVSRAATLSAARQGRISRLAAIVLPTVVFPSVTVVDVPYTVSHDTRDLAPRVRKFVQQLSNIINGLLLSGELKGTITEPKLGYQPDNTLDWGLSPPYTVKQALDDLASRGGATVEGDIADVAADLAAHIADTTSVHGIADTSALIVEGDSRLTDSRAPTGTAGGVLGGTYPNPSFAADMATQAELDVVAGGVVTVASNLSDHIGDTADAHDASAISYDGGTGMSATDVEAAIDELATEKANAAVTLTAGDGLSGGGDLSASRTFTVNVDGSTIETNADAIRVKDAGITNAKLAVDPKRYIFLGL